MSWCPGARMNGIGKGKARQPYEFGVEVSLAITERHGPVVYACVFAGIRFRQYSTGF